MGRDYDRVRTMVHRGTGACYVSDDMILATAAHGNQGKRPAPKLLANLAALSRVEQDPGKEADQLVGCRQRQHV